MFYGQSQDAGQISCEQFLDEYKLFLADSGKKPSVVSLYAGKLKYFLRHSYSVNDLIGTACKLIKEYSPGGANYNPKEHRTTVAALKQLLEFVYAGYIATFQIKYTYPVSTWAAPVYSTEYTIENRCLSVRYNNGTVNTKKIADIDFYELIKLLKEWEFALSNVYQLVAPPPTMFDYSPGYYHYCFGAKEGRFCPSLFENSTWAEEQYRLLIAKIME